MRKIELSNVQPLDSTFRQNIMGIGDLFGGYGLSIEVNSADECPICHYGIDLSQNAWINYHDMHSTEQTHFNIFSIHINKSIIVIISNYRKYCFYNNFFNF